MKIFSTYLPYSSMKRILKVIHVAKDKPVDQAVQILNLCILKGSKDIRKFLLCLLSSKIITSEEKLNIYANEGFRSRKAISASKQFHRSTRRGARIFVCPNAKVEGEK